MVAVVGQSGGGKSTIVKLIEHFYELSSGQITLSKFCEGISWGKGVCLNCLHAHARNLWITGNGQGGPLYYSILYTHLQ